MTEQRDYGDENDACFGCGKNECECFSPSPCICRKWAPHRDCPKHGKPGQLTLDDPRANPHFYDPEEADIPY